jgi:hypothetical protein
MVFGSFFGDWDADNDFTRAPLASGNGLASCWVSRPFWFFHPMAAGQTLGYCTKLTMDNGLNYQDYTFGYGEGGVHLGLMGDPTLRQDYFFVRHGTPSTFTAQQAGSEVDLNWSALSDAQGYDLYRSNSLGQAFEKLNDAPIVGTTYTDPTPSDTNYYLLRAASLVTSASATYYADGPGMIQEVIVTKSGVSLVDAGSQSLHVGQTDQQVRIDVRISAATDVDLTILDPLGRTILILEHSQFNPGSKTYVIPNHTLASGLYFARLRTSTGEYSSKIMIAK